MNDEKEALDQGINVCLQDNALADTELAIFWPWSQITLNMLYLQLAVWSGIWC